MSEKVFTGERSPSEVPAISVSRTPSASVEGISAALWCEKAGAVSSCALGSATHTCSADSVEPAARRSSPVRSLWTMPDPAVIQLISPGRIVWTLPRLSRWTIAPSSRCVTVASPICGCGLTSSPWPASRRIGPNWSKKMNGPTIRRCAEGKARRTVKPSPRSRTGGRITISTPSTPLVRKVMPVPPFRSACHAASTNTTSLSSIAVTRSVSRSLIAAPSRAPTRIPSISTAPVAGTR